MGWVLPHQSLITKIPYHQILQRHFLLSDDSSLCLAGMRPSSTVSHGDMTSCKPVACFQPDYFSRFGLRSEWHPLTTPVASLPSRRPQVAAHENISFSYWACTVGAASLPWCWRNVCVICGPDAHAVLCGHWPQGYPRGTVR